MDASRTNRLERTRMSRILGWACLLLAISTAGCAGLSKGKNGTAQSPFAGAFESKKPREIIDPNMGMAEYDRAKEKFDQQKYDEAANEFKEISKKFYDYPVEEDSLYMLAECRFAAKRYPWALDAYEGLIKKYPSTRYLERSTKRLYTIGAIWLGGEETPKTEELMQVSATDVTDPGKSPQPASGPGFSVLPNVADRSRPLFDTPGHALRALKAVWLNDPLGPLADDALMLTSAYYIRQGDFREADHYLDILRKEYPKSEHSQTAFVVGSHVKLANYQGARYDGRDLVDADDLIRSTLNLYPQINDREGLKGELEGIRERGAERYWSRIEYYNRRAKPQSEAIYCEMLIKEYPNTTFAERAKKRLQELGPNYQMGIVDQQTLQNGSIPLESSNGGKRTRSAEVEPQESPGFPSKGLPKPESQKRPGRSGQAPREISPDSMEEESVPAPRAPGRSQQPGAEPELVDGIDDSEIEPTRYSEPAGRVRL